MYIVNSAAAHRSHAGRPRSSSYWARARSRPCSDPHITSRVRWRGISAFPNRGTARNRGERERDGTDTARQILAPGSSSGGPRESGRGSQGRLAGRQKRRRRRAASGAGRRRPAAGGSGVKLKRERGRGRELERSRETRAGRGSGA
jgi:hypothetical protein